jgi:hypothetical protein
MPLARSYFSGRATRGQSGRQIVPSALIKLDLVNPLTADADGYSASHAGQAAASTVDMTLGGALTSGGVGRADYARNVVITVTHASAVVAMNGTITGTDINGRVITEDWSVTAGGTSKTFTGKKGFKTITRITETVAANASTNTIIAGTGTVFGLPNKAAVASAVKEVAIGSVVTTGTMVAASTAATDDRRGTYSPSAAPNDTNDYTIWFISDDPENDLAL